MRKEINLNNNWKYFKGKSDNCEDVLFDDSAWKSVNLPHNTSLYTKDNKNAYQGISVYRKNFSLDESCEGKRLLLTFEGVMQRCIVYLNGAIIAQSNNGYIPFCIDISDKINYSEGNILTVVTDSRPSPKYTPGKENPDFQYFGGIYRNVTITVTDKVFITNSVEENKTAGGGLFITTPFADKDNAVVNVKTHIKNSSDTNSKITLKTEITYNDKIVAENEETLTCKANDYAQFDCDLSIDDPMLWHPYTPYLYTIKSCVYADDRLVDEISTQYGVRKIEWTHDGLFINGERFTAQGANLHSDIFVLGNAIPDNAVFEEIKRLKENGFDFIRMSHYPHSKAYYDACDKYGVLVLDCMSGWQNFSNTSSFKNSTYDELRTMIRYSRNHPSIIAWETSLNVSSYTTDWAKKVNEIAHEEYPQNSSSRMWTAGWKTDEFDVALGASQHDIRHLADKSEKGVIISEYGDWDYGGTASTSRVKREDCDNAMLTQASNHIESAILTRSKSWYAADALWCYDDYAGCDSIMNYGGVVDMYRLNKYSAYFYKSQRDADVDMSKFGIATGAMVFIANSLDSSSPNDVTVFSNCAEIELIADGKSLGRQKPDSEYYGNNSKKMLPTDSLPHPPFTFKNANNNAKELTAIGYINGKALTKQTVTKPQNASAIRIKAESEAPIKANGSDVKLIWVSLADDNNAVVKEDKIVSFSVKNGYVIGCESVNTVGGQIGVWVRANSSESDTSLTLTASADNLKSDTVSIDVKGVENVNSSADFNEFAGVTEEQNINTSILLDVAREKPAYSSSDADGCIAQNGNNGEPSTYWYPASVVESWWYVDTGDTYNFERIEITWNEEESHSFVIEVSDDAKSWTQILDCTAGKREYQSVREISGNGRYIRIKLRSKSDKPQGFNMFSVYGK